MPDAREGAVFGDDYLDFYASELHEGVNDDEAAMIALLTQLAPGERVLDLPCGHGRIAERLAARGADVVGIDRCELFLERARASATQRGVAVDYQPGDWSALAFADEFDVLISWFTSFGYSDGHDGAEDTALRAQLQQMLRALKRGGRVLIETLNLHAAALTDHETSAVKSIEDAAGRHFMIDRSRFDPNTGHLHVRRAVAREGEGTRESSYSLRLFSAPELRGWLREAGFEDVQTYGADGEVFRVDSDRLITVARRG